MSYQNYFSQALKNIYGKKQQQGYRPKQGYGGFAMAMPESAPRIDFRTPIGQGYRQRNRGSWQQNQGYGGFMGQGYSGLDNPLMASPVSEALTLSPQADTMQNMFVQPQTSPVSEALASSPWADIMQNMPTSWDWEGGESSPYGIRTPWLGYSWHYDESGKIVPNNPNNPMAPWNMAGSTQTYEGWLETQQPSPLFNKGVR